MDPDRLISQVSPHVYARWSPTEEDGPRLDYLDPIVPPAAAADIEPEELAPLSRATRLALDEQLTARDPQRMRWHVSAVPDAVVPSVVAWQGTPDSAQPRLLSIKERPAVWMGSSVEHAAESAAAALDARGIPVHLDPAPPALLHMLAARGATVPGPVGVPARAL